MNKYLKWRLLLLPLLCSIFLISCQNADITFNDLNSLKYGEEYSNSILKSKTHIYNLQLEEKNDIIAVYVYRHIVGENSIDILDREIGYEICAAAFRNNKLFFWGTIDDFKRNDIRLIRNIGELVSDKIAEMVDRYEII